ncbi:hypothetical protein A4S05_01120 [Nostoc sp. KVJ20]|nr:hypothetical protein A4S05_01120 [Nostoc sp. KVJ20]
MLTKISTISLLYLVLIKPNNKLRVKVKYKIYKAVSGLIKELKMEAQKLSQLLAIHVFAFPIFGRVQRD